MRRNRVDTDGEEDDENAPPPIRRQTRSTNDAGAEVEINGDNVVNIIENALVPSDESAIDSDSELSELEQQEVQQHRPYSRFGEPESLLAELATLRIKRSKVLNLQPLQNLCLRAVSFNLPYFLSKKQPFHSLPGIVLKAVMKELHHKQLLNNVDVVSMIATPNSRYALLDFSRNLRWITFDRMEAMNHISNVCSGSLQHLEMYVHHIYSSMCPPLPIHLHNLLSSLHNLEHLQLRASGIRDEGLEVIANSCPRLRTLDISYNLAVTDDGITVLCGTEENKDGCRHLEEINLRSTGLTYAGLSCALTQLHQLTKLLHHDVDQAVLQLTKPSKLENLSFTSASTEDQCNLICDKVPCVTELEINCNIDNWECLENFKGVTQFVLHNKGFPCQTVLPHIKHLFSKLTKLELGFGLVDVTLIGWHCVNLEKLIWNCNATRECEYELITHEHFSKLTAIHICCYDDNAYFPSLALKTILSSEDLEIIRIENFDFPLGFLESLIAEAKCAHGIFSQLRKLKFRYCDYLMLRNILEIVCLSPKMLVLDILGSLGPPTDWKHLVQFIKSNAPYISVPFNHTPPPSLNVYRV